MNPSRTESLVQKPNALLAILSGGSICGVLDITAEFVVYGFFGLKPVPLCKGYRRRIVGCGPAGADLRPRCPPYSCTFFIAMSAATVYVAVGRWIGFLVKHAVLSGVL